MPRNKTIFSLFIGILISIAAMYFALRNVPFSTLVTYLMGVQYSYVAVAVFITLVCWLLRVLRWQMLLSPVKKVGFLNCYHPVMIGVMLNCILPGRAGEIIRPVIVSKLEHIPFSTSVATIVIERVFDITILLAFFLLSLTSIDIHQGASISFGELLLNGDMLNTIFRGMALFCIALILFLISVVNHSLRSFIVKLLGKFHLCLFFLSDDSKLKFHDKIIVFILNLLENFADGTNFFKNPFKVFLCFVYSFMIWGFQVYAYCFIGYGCKGISISFFEMAAVMVIICFFIALPSVPGFWGLWEAGGVFALLLFGIQGKDAAGFTLLTHVVMIIPVILLGLVSALALGKDAFHRVETIELK